MTRHRSTSLGFTLVELLVGLTLVALISVALMGGLRFGIRAWETGSDRLDQFSRIEVVQNLLRRELAQATLPRIPVDQAVIPPAFRGNPGELQFLAPLPVHFAEGGLRIFRLEARPRGLRYDLVLSWRMYRPEILLSEAYEAEEETVLLEELSGIELSYFGALAKDQPPEWLSDWPAELGRPQLVRLRVNLPEDDRRRWPDLIIRLPGAAG